MSRLILVITFVATLTITVNPARILGIYPMPSISHQVVFRALTLELVKRGHELVVITPNPAFKDDNRPANLREIDISAAYDYINDLPNNEDLTKYLKRGVIADFDIMSKSDVMDNIMLHMFDYDEVNQLLADKNQKFDLVIVEGLAYSPLIFSKVFDTPAILFTSLCGTAVNYETVGAVSRHPVYYQNIIYGTRFGNSIVEKIKSLIIEYRILLIEKEKEVMENKFLKSRFGPDAPTVAELNKNVVMLFSNCHPILDSNRPVPPGAVYLGALHLQPTKELPQDLKAYLDNSSRGVVYVSFGTNVRLNIMDKDLLDAFIDAFKAIPYDVLWKVDGVTLEEVPKNIKIQKWFPQRDLLGHPNIKMFVTQGGLQSTDEAIDAEVPLIGVPMLADQFYNTAKYEELGIGVKLDPYTLVADDLIKAVHLVANDTSYKEKIKQLRALIHDQPTSPLERAVWWTEHILRHPRSRHLLGAAAQTSWSEYFMLDVLAVLATAGAALVTIIALSLYCIVKMILKARSGKLKLN